MFPAWWLLGVRNNETPVQEEDEIICWPLPGSGEIDIMEHYGQYGGQTGCVGRSILPLGATPLSRYGLREASASQMFFLAHTRQARVPGMFDQRPRV